MIVKYLINIKHLLLDLAPENDAVDIDGIRFSNNEKFRSATFYDKVALKNIGLGLLSQHLNETAYAMKKIDFDTLSNETSKKDVQIEITRIAQDILHYVNDFLFYLWFVKDNCVAGDYIYGVRDEPNSDGYCGIIIDQRNISMCNGDANYYSKFNLDELGYAYGILEASKKIHRKSLEKEEFNIRKEQYDRGSVVMMPKLKYVNFHRIERALFFLSNARSSQNILHKIATYINTIECLFSTERDNVNYKISQRVALYAGNDYEERQWIMKFIKEAYDIRSAYVHGSAITKSERKGKDRDNPAFGEENIYYISKELDNLLRTILTKVIMNDSLVFLDDNKLVKMFNQFIYQPNYYM